MKSLNFKNLVWNLFKRLANLNLSLFILSLITVACIFGSILEQEQDFSYYNLNYSDYTFLIYFLGLDHIFRTSWFISLLCTLALSLISCTFTTQLPSLRNARRWKFISGRRMLDLSNYNVDRFCNSRYSFINIAYALLRLNFFVFSRSNSVYAYKGLYGRIAPIFVHFSIISILLGSMYGFFYSFVLQENIAVGEIFHFKNLVYSGFYSTLQPDLFGYIDDFYIKYYSNGSVRQFFSKIYIYLSNKHLLNFKVIQVNSPLATNRIVFYQSNWDLNSVRIRVGDNYSFQNKLSKTRSAAKPIWISRILMPGYKEIRLVFTGLDDKVLICDTSGIILKDVFLKQKFYINSVPYVIDDIIPTTGIQIKYDPGIFLVYTGFFIMITTTFMSYLSYSEIWVYYKLNCLEFCGSTNRAVLFLERDLSTINDVYTLYSYYIVKSTYKLNSLLR